MPYTFAHIGYILPLKKNMTSIFSITGLVFGSITPDFDILFRLTNIRDHLFQYDLFCIIFIIYPLSLVCSIFFHSVCRNISIMHLPDLLEHKYKIYYTVDFLKILRKDFIKVTYSILLAIIIHLALDFIGHSLNAFEVKTFISNLTKNETLIWISYVSAIYAVPILFSIAGFYLIIKNEIRQRISLKLFTLTKNKFLFWLSMGVMTLFFCVLKILITKTEFEYFLDYIAISITSSFILAYYTTCFFYSLYSKKTIK